MPAIWNVNQGYNIDNKKISSKLTFKEGEKFVGRIVSRGKGNEATIKMANGWQFSAEIDEDANIEEGRPVKFEVQDFKDGKLKLKVIKDSTNTASNSNSSLESVLEKEGLPKEDVKLLRDMIKRDIPLTKENILKFKSIIGFNEKVNIDVKEIDAFIEKYIDSKGIAKDSAQAQNINKLLKDFIVAFKGLTKDDLMVFLENNIDFNKENIESFNKIFKNELGMSNLFNEISKDAENLTKEVNINSKEEVLNKELGSNKDSNLNKEAIMSEDEVKTEVNESIKKNIDLAQKIYDSNNGKGKVSMLSLLKSLVGEQVKDINTTLKEIIINNSNKFNDAEFNNTIKLINDMNEDEFIDLLREGAKNIQTTEDGDLPEFSKKNIESVLNSLVNKDIDLTSQEFKSIRESLVFRSISSSDVIDQDNENNLMNKDIGFSSEGKDINNNNITTENSKNLSAKEQIEIVNKDISNDKTVLKEELKNEVTKNMLKGSNLFNDANSKELVEVNIREKLNTMKELLQNILKHTDIKGTTSEKIIELMKANINDFKLFNSISNEYYYLDMPIKRDEREYPCKLIIKDDRKDGKKIDRSNVRMVVSVKTINLGMIDNYISIRDKNLDIDIKCDKKYMKTISRGKDSLKQGVETIGFKVNIKISEKLEDVNLSNCREFFADGGNQTLDITV